MRVNFATWRWKSTVHIVQLIGAISVAVSWAWVCGNYLGIPPLQAGKLLLRAGVLKTLSVHAEPNRVEVKCKALVVGVLHGIMEPTRKEATMMRTVKLDSFYTEEVTPDEYIRIFRDERDKIDSARIVPLRLGQKGFGYILIVKKTPVFALNRYKSLANAEQER